MRWGILVMALGCLPTIQHEIRAADLPQVVEIAIPGYPRMASGAREEGEVSVDVEVAPDGQVAAAKAATGPDRLRPWAEAAARKWRFEPPQTGTAKTRVVFAFVLQVGLSDPPSITASFKAPNRVEVFAEKREMVILADPPVEDVVKKQRHKRSPK